MRQVTERHRNLAVILFLIVIAIAILNPGCTHILSRTESTNTPAMTQSIVPAVIKNVNAGEAFKIIQSNNDNPNFVILDVRMPGEYNTGHIAKAVNINFQSADFRSLLGNLNSSNTYLVYCGVGGRSAQAAQIMQQLGFKDIINLSGGITQWVNNQYPVEK